MILIIPICTTFQSEINASPILVDTTFSVPAQIQAVSKGNIQHKFLYSDKLGQHILILSRLETKIPIPSVDLRATLYVSGNNKWKQEWIIYDKQDCAELDLDADFNKPSTIITDLDSNGIFESTVVYQMACSGGIDYKITKAILQEGKSKYAVRGDSYVNVGGMAPFGGNYIADKTLESKPGFKKHLIFLWKRAANVAN